MDVVSGDRHAPARDSALRYDVVVCTLNRQESLLKCLSLIEKQTEKPRRVIVVDASDDHETVRHSVLDNRAQGIDWQVIHAQQRNLPHQRNLGLQEVHSDVVLLPDDDSMLYPTAAAEIMAAYRSDEKGVIGGVSGIAATRSPLGEQTVVARSRALKDRLQPLRNRIERFIAPAPFATHPQFLWMQRQIPPWVDGKTYRPVESISGFLMSLRSGLAKRHLFDETLGYGIGYALHEDIELCLRLQTNGYLLIGAHKAQIYHDVHPSKRAGGFNYGFCWFANYLYVCVQNIPRASMPSKVDVHRFLRYKLALYHARAVVQRDEYSQEVFEGALTAWRQKDEIISARPGEAAEAYRRLCDRYIHR